MYEVYDNRYKGDCGCPSCSFHVFDASESSLFQVSTDAESTRGACSDCEDNNVSRLFQVSTDASSTRAPSSSSSGSEDNKLTRWQVDRSSRGCDTRRKRQLEQAMEVQRQAKQTRKQRIWQSIKDHPGLKGSGRGIASFAF